MRRYIDYAVIWDTILAIIFAIILCSIKTHLKMVFDPPKILSIQNFIVSLITVCAALIGFMLTIITVIVTFKTGFENETHKKKTNIDPKEFPIDTVFDNKVSKEEQFYGTAIHKKVVDVFVHSTYEIGAVLCFLLFIQFDIVNCSVFIISVISSSLFLMIVLSILRSLFIFRLFLNVHLHNKSMKKYY